MSDKSPAEISKMMSVSESLGELNHERFQEWERPFTPDNSRPALLAFTGDVYLGWTQAARSPNAITPTPRRRCGSSRASTACCGRSTSCSPTDSRWGSQVATDRGKDLYTFWGDRITNQLNADMAESPGARVLVNLASNEYFGSVHADAIDARVVSPTFLDSKDGGDYKIVSFFAKRARGAMTGWIIRNPRHVGEGPQRV